MERLKSLLIIVILPVLAVVAVAFGSVKASRGKMQVCNQQYALCTSAPCIPDPKDHTKAICFCVVEEGKSMATTSCDSLQPSTDAQGVRTIYSTFSFEQFKQGKKGMTCPSGTPWTWCLNKRCTVDPLDPKKAICVCDVVTTGEWTTLGGNCDPATCQSGYWSGASMEDFEESGRFLVKALGLQKSPAKLCPAASP